MEAIESVLNEEQCTWHAIFSASLKSPHKVKEFGQEN